MTHTDDSNQYRLSIPATIWYFGSLGIALVLAVPTFTPQAAVITGILHVICGGGITLGAHRYFSHATFTTSKSFETLLAIAYSISFDRAGQGVISWVLSHQAHHRFADTDRDPHSPRDGFWWSFAGHHLYRYQPHWQQEHYLDQAPRRLTRRRLLVVLDKPTTLWAIQGLMLLLLATTGAFIGGVPMALSFVVWGIFVRYVLTQTLHSLVDTFNHGCPWPLSRIRDRFHTQCDAKEQYLLWLLQFGNETHHNFHHAFPRAANNGGSLRQWWRWDTDALGMKLLERLGVIKDCRWVTVAEMRFRELGES